MEKKYFTEDEKRNAKNLQQKLRYHRNKEWWQNYKEVNKEKIKTYNKELYRKTHPIKLKETNLDKIKEANRIKKNEYQKNRKKNNSLYKLSCNIRTYLSNTFKHNGYKKKTKTFDILGCSSVEFKQYLESKFESWMNWNNYGKYNGTENYGWDIDHITPLKTAVTEEDVINLNHYTNLQPLCSYINRRIKILMES
jgi:hypothetical protein